MSRPIPGHIAKSVLTVRNGLPTRSTVALIVEEPLEIRVNGAPYAVVMRTPGHERELTLGFCLTEGIVDSVSEVESFEFCADAGDNRENVVNVVLASSPASRLASTQGLGSRPNVRGPRGLASRSSCGICGVTMIEDLDRRLWPLATGPRWPTAKLVDLQYRMTERQALSKLTNGAHAVMLARGEGDPIVVREDVGRHNALDKAIGFAMLNDVDCPECVALLSGRASFEMVQKAVRARIPLLAGVSAPTSLAVDLAERLNCTLVGRLRDQSMVIYAHPERLLDVS